MPQLTSAHNDGYAAVLREAVETIRSRDHVNVLTPEGLREALTEPALYRQYKGMLCEGMSADSAEAMGIFADNFQLSVFRESSLSGIQPVSVLTMPMLRKAWPKIGVKEALPTEPVKTPKFTVSHLIPYIKDPVTGLKKELPAALRDSALATARRRSTAPLALCRWTPKTSCRSAALSPLATRWTPCSPWLPWTWKWPMIPARTRKP